MPIRDNPVLQRFVAFARNSPWLMIAIGLHVIVGLVLSVVVIRHELRKTSSNATQIAVGVPRESVPELPPPPEPHDRYNIPEMESLTQLVSIEEEELFLPSEEVPEDVDLHDDVGNPTGDDGDLALTGGTSIGVGTGGHPGTGTPGMLGKRLKLGTGSGQKGVRVTGPRVGTEQAVLEGLRWLVRHQETDGSWSPRTLHTHCSTVPACIPADPSLDSSFDVGMTALALLAFLGQGITLGSKLEIVDTAVGRKHLAGDVVKKGLRWLLERQKPDGSFSGSFELAENDTLPTMVLCEAYGLSARNRALRLPAQRALDFLVAAQRRAADGSPSGWGPGSQAELDARHARGELDDAAWAEASQALDLSITCWVVMALKSAQSCGFAVPDEALAGALAYGVAATGAEVPASPAAAPDGDDEFTSHAARRAALGMLIRIFAGGEITDPYLESAAREIAADVPEVTKDGRSVDFYYWYFATLALNQYDGPDSPRAGAGRHWSRWDDGLVAALLPLQEQAKKRDVCTRGGWLQEARGNRRGLALYNTAMNVLTLEVYYRFENVFGAAARERAGLAAPASTPK